MPSATRSRRASLLAASLTTFALVLATVVGGASPAAAVPGWAFTPLPVQMSPEGVVADDAWVVSRDANDLRTAVAYNTTTGVTHAFAAPGGEPLTLASIAGDTVVGYSSPEAGGPLGVFVHDLAAGTTREVPVADARPLVHHANTLVTEDPTTGLVSVRDLTTGTGQELPAIDGRRYKSQAVLTDGAHVVRITERNDGQFDPYAEKVFIYTIATGAVREFSLAGASLTLGDLHNGILSGQAFLPPGAVTGTSTRTFEVPVTATSEADATLTPYPSSDATLQLEAVNHRWLSGNTVTQYPPSSHDYIYDRTAGVTRPLYIPAGYLSGLSQRILADNSIVGSVHDVTAGAFRLGVWRAAEQVGLTSVTLTNPQTNGGDNPGDTLTSTLTGLTPTNATRTYQWVRDGVPIRDATGATRVLNTHDIGHKVALMVTATAPGYAPRTVTSVGRYVATGSLPNVTKASIVGTAKVGSTLTVRTGTWSPTPTSYTLLWYRGNTRLRDVTGTTYTLTAADKGYRIRVTVEARRAYYYEGLSNVTTGVVAAGTITSATPKISGTPQVGQTLTLSRGTWKPSGVTFTQQWYRNSYPIQGATGTTRKLYSTDKGARIHVRVTARKSGYTTTSRLTAQTPAVTYAMTPATPTISGTAKVGRTLYLSRGTWKPSGVTFTQQWYRNSLPIRGATGTTRKLYSSDRGARIHVRVTARKSGYTTTSRLTAKTVAVRS